MTSKATISKWGNSTGLRIPRPILRQANFHEGQTVEISVQENDILIRSTHTPTLSELCAKITKKNLHTETEWGQTVGDEIW